MFDPTLILGPLGVLVVLVYAVRELWLDHKRTDAKRDAVIEAFPTAIADLTAVVKDVAEREKTRGRTRAEDP